MISSYTTNEIVTLFTEAVLEKNYVLISELLSDKGEYTIQDKDLETIDVNKTEFLKWFLAKLRDIKILSVDYDQCSLCKIGNPVIIFNKGLFPKTAIDDSEKSMTGLMLDIQENKIIGITFCYSFLHRENKYLLDCKAEKIKKLMNEGFSIIDAYCMSIHPSGELTQKEYDEIERFELYFRYSS
jgi:hypothetical protein